MNSIRTHARRLGLVGALWAIAASVTGGVPTAGAAASSVTFNTPGTFTWTVPAGVHQVVLDVSGAQGGRANLGRAGGLGGRTQATLSVTPGEALEVRVGGAGGDSPPGYFHSGDAGANGGGRGGDSIVTAAATSFGGGGGGGASDVRRAPYHLFDRLVVGAGGGGGSLSCTGGGGGGDVGGVSDCSKWSGGPGFPNLGGFGGSADNELCCRPGNSGDLGQGGDGQVANFLPLTGEGVGGGGGGGGWYGGGGGGSGLHTPNIGALYRLQLAPAPAGLVANWQFEEGRGVSVTDTTGNHHQASLMGSATFSTDVAY
jgi:hypothetical protein